MSAVADLAESGPLVALAAAALGGGLLVFVLMGLRLRRLQAALRRLEAARQILARQNAVLSQATAATDDKLHALLVKQADMLRRARFNQMGQLVATVAHEIRNPLGSLRISAYLLKAKLPRNPDWAMLLERMETSVRRCDAIITQLLDYASDSALNLAVDDLHAWMGNLLEEQVGVIPPAISVRLIIGEGPLEASFDHLRLRRAVLNLIANAADALASPVAQTSAPVIEVEIKQTRRGAEIEVRDTGPGMAPDVLARVGEPLFTTKSFGTGLGVASCRKVAELHGGALELQSDNCGTRARLWFPLAQQAALAA